jgi:hypothetical protein
VMVRLLLLFWRHASESVLFWGSISQVSTSWALLAWEVVLEKMLDALQPTLDALALAKRASVELDLPLRDSPDYSIGALVMLDSDLEVSDCVPPHSKFSRNRV